MEHYKNCQYNICPFEAVVFCWWGFYMFVDINLAMAKSVCVYIMCSLDYERNNIQE